MRSYLSNRHCAAGAFLVLSLLCGGVLGSSQSRADGALAIGLPPDVVKGGFTYGYSNNNADANHAEAKALDACRTTKDAANDVKLRSLCKVIQDYSNQCVAVAMDPAAGTPGVGWGWRMICSARNARRSANAWIPPARPAAPPAWSITRPATVTRSSGPAGKARLIPAS